MCTAYWGCLRTIARLAPGCYYAGNSVFNNAAQCSEMVGHAWYFAKLLVRRQTALEACSYPTDTTANPKPSAVCSNKAFTALSADDQHSPDGSPQPPQRGSLKQGSQNCASSPAAIGSALSASHILPAQACQPDQIGYANNQHYAEDPRRKSPLLSLFAWQSLKAPTSFCPICPCHE